MGTDSYILYSEALGGLIAILVFLFYLKQMMQYRKMCQREELMEQLIGVLQPDKGIEKNLNDILALTRNLINAPGYAFYGYDPKNGAYRLKSVLHAQRVEKQAKPAYSGLLPYNKEVYIPQLSFPREKVPERTSIVKEGEVSIIVMPIEGQLGIVNIGPVKTLPKWKRELLNFWSKKLEPVLDALSNYDCLKSQVELVVTSNNAIQSISQILYGYDEILCSIMFAAIKALGASGGILLIKNEDKFSVPLSIGMDKESEEQFKNDEQTHALLKSMMTSKGVTTLIKSDNQYFKIPSYLALYAEMFYFIGVGSEKTDGLACFWYNKITEDEKLGQYRIATLEILTKRFEEILDNQLKYAELTKSYIDMLKIQVQTMDASSPYSIGYSEMTARYAAVICREMGLENHKAKDIILAAYLCNIGIVGLTNAILQKDGRFTELECEVMKLHSDVGASIAEAILPNKELSANIRHHHERMDGCGYPARLKGNEIPLGARIIAVVQTFLAMISGRINREPLPFDKAIQSLKAAAGTQLDPQIVDLLICWFKRKRLDAVDSGKSLGRCWEMRCTAQNICAQCPAFEHKVKNCWEIEGNNCIAHGSHCSSCFIYTEFQGRESRTEVIQR